MRILSPLDSPLELSLVQTFFPHHLGTLFFNDVTPHRRRNSPILFYVSETVDFFSL